MSSEANKAHIRRFHEVFRYREDTLGLYQQLGAFPPDLPRPS